jgi:hypothetical protein
VEHLQAGAFYGRLVITDTPVYHDVARAIAGGALPYGGVAVDCPPASLPAFLLPQLLGDGSDASFDSIFRALMLGCGALLAGIVVVVTRLRWIPGAHPWAAAVLVVASPLLVGPVILTRFDLWPALLTLLAVTAALAGRLRVSAAVLALAIAAKVWPVVLVPLLLALALPGRAAITALFLVRTRLPRVVVAACVLAMVGSFVAYFPFGQVP